MKPLPELMESILLPDEAPTIHPAYNPPLERIESYIPATDRDSMQGGELLGSSARPDMMRDGDIITAVDNFPNHPDGPVSYYYDPALIITGATTRDHWRRNDWPANSGNICWRRVEPEKGTV